MIFIGLDIKLLTELFDIFANVPFETSVSNKDCYIFRLGAAVRKFQLGYVAAKKTKTTAVITQTSDRMEVQMNPASNLSTMSPATTVNNPLIATRTPTVSISEESVSIKVTTSQTDGTTGLATVTRATPVDNIIEASTGNEHLAAVDANGTFNATAEIVPSIFIKVEKDSDDETDSDQGIEQAEAVSLNVATDSKVTNDVKHSNFINDIAEEVSNAAINSNLPETNRSAVSMTEEEIERHIKNIIAAANHWQKNIESSNESSSIKRKLSTQEANTILIKRIKSEDLDLSSEEGL